MVIEAIASQPPSITIWFDRQEIRVLANILNYVANGRRFKEGVLEKLTDANPQEINEILDTRFLVLPEDVKFANITLTQNDLITFCDLARAVRDGHIVRDSELDSIISCERSYLITLSSGLDEALKVMLSQNN